MNKDKENDYRPHVSKALRRELDNTIRRGFRPDEIERVNNIERHAAARKQTDERSARQYAADTEEMLAWGLA